MVEREVEKKKKGIWTYIFDATCFGYGNWYTRQKHLRSIVEMEKRIE